MMIHARESQVLEGGLAQKLKEAILRSLRCKAAGADLFEQSPELQPVHRSECVVVDFDPNSTITWAIVPRDGFISLYDAA